MQTRDDFYGWVWCDCGATMTNSEEEVECPECGEILKVVKNDKKN